MNKLTTHYNWVSVRGLEADVTSAKELIIAEVGEEAFSAGGKMWEVATAPGVWELDYRHFYSPVSRETLSRILAMLPNLNFRAVLPKLYKYSEGHYEAFSRAGTRDCIEERFGCDYEENDYPLYDWWRAVDFSDETTADTSANGSSDFQFKHGKGGLTITGYRGYDVDAVIPSQIGDNPVVAIGKEAFEEPVGLSAEFTLKSVVIPHTVRIIEEKAFSGCRDLSKVAFEEGSELSVIGDEAFYLSPLEAITLPKSLEKLGLGVFHGCYELKQIALEEGNEHFAVEKGALYTADMDRLVRVFAVGDGCFEMPSTVTVIEESAFEDTGLEAIVVPAAVTNIGVWAFAGCYNLSSIEFAEGSQLESIGESAFSDCGKLSFIGFPQSLKRFDEWFGPSCGIPFFVPGITCAEIKQRQYKACAAQGFVMGMSGGGNAAPEVEKGYVKYIKGHASEVLEGVGYGEDAVRWIIEHDCISPKDARDNAQVAKKRGLTEQAAMLTAFGEMSSGQESKTASTKKASSGKPKSPTVAELKKIWKTKKREDGTFAIETWLGKTASAVVPSEIGKAIVVTSILDYAFAPFDGQDRPNKEVRERVLESVVISEGVMQIGYHTFALCQSLRYVELPSSMETMGKETFYKCDLEKLVVRSTAKIPAHALDNTRIAKLYISGLIGKQADTCDIREVFFHESMSEKDKKSVQSVLKKLPNGSDIEYGEWK